MTIAGTAIPGALYTRLSSDDTLTGMLANGSSSVYDIGVTEAADFPYVRFTKMGGAPDHTTPSDMRSYLYSVVGFSKVSQSEANQIDNRIDALLNKYNLPLETYTTIWAVRETELPDLVEHPKDDVNIYRSGALYRITIDV